MTDKDLKTDAEPENVGTLPDPKPKSKKVTLPPKKAPEPEPEDYGKGGVYISVGGGKRVKA